MSEFTELLLKVSSFGVAFVVTVTFMSWLLHMVLPKRETCTCTRRLCKKCGRDIK